MKPARYSSRIRAFRDVAPGVREITLAPPAEPFRFEPGQWISLHLPVGDKPPLVRAYTLAAPSSPGGELVLCLDRYPDGLGSEYLFRRSVGEILAYDGPLGRFVLPSTEADLLCVARYTGVVPFRAMLLHLRRNAPSGRVTLVYSAACPADLAYREELETAARQEPWLDLCLLVDTPADGWSGSVGPALELLPSLVGGRTDLTPMICGVGSFVRPVRQFFQDLGYERRAVRVEMYD